MNQKKMLIFMIVTLLISSILTVNISGLKTNNLNNGNIFYVGGSGEGNYSTIQAAIDASSEGDTVYVYDDSSPYFESVLLDKSINLIGENKETTIIDGNGAEYVIKIISDGILITGFTIKHSGDWVTDGGIGVFSDDNTIDENIITHTLNGLFLEGCDGNTISNNIIFNNDVYPDSRGISMWTGDDPWRPCSNTNIINNEIYLNTGSGIWSDFSEKTTIIDNEIFNNRINGIQLNYDEDVDIINNNIESNDQYGIYLFSGSSFGVNDIDVIDNYIFNNEHGIYIIGDATGIKIRLNDIIENKKNGIFLTKNVNDNEIFENNIMFNRGKGIHIKLFIDTWVDEEFFSNNNQILHNNIICNGVNAKDECTNYWNAESYGNYWSDWSGIGPYKINGGGNQDNYPLQTAYNIESVAPTKPNKPEGMINGKINVPYLYKTSSIDPEGEKILYLFEWGDGSESKWLGPYNSGETIDIIKKWSEEGSYQIKVKSKDIYGYESEWSDPIQVTIPRYKSLQFDLFSKYPLMNFLFKIFLKLSF